MGHKIIFAILLFSLTGLLIPPIQSAYSHPLASDVDNLDHTKAWALFAKCEKVRVTAQISEIVLHWDGSTEEKRDSFNDGIISSLSDGEIELLYKIWEPGHSQSPIDYGNAASYNRANVASSFIEDDWHIDFSSIEDDYMKINRDGFPVKPRDQLYINELSWAGAIKKVPSKVVKTSYFDQYGRQQLKTWMGDSHEKYVHITCKENLHDLIIVLSVSEVDDDGYTTKNKIDNLLGGSNIEKSINSELSQKSLTDWSPERFVAGALNHMMDKTVDKVSTIAKDKLTNQITGGEIKTYAALQKGISALKKEGAEKLGKLYLGKTATKFIAKKIGLVIVGPVGWAFFIIDTAHDIYEIYNWGKSGRQPLGITITSIPLDKFDEKEEAEFVLSTQRSYKPLCIPFDFASVGLVTSSQDIQWVHDFIDTMGDAELQARRTLIPIPEFAIPIPYTIKMENFFLKYPVLSPLCKNMYDDKPNYYLDKWKAEGRTDKVIPFLKERGYDRSGISTPEQYADYLAEGGKFVAESQRDIVKETEPILAGTVSVTFKVTIEPMYKCKLESTSSTSNTSLNFDSDASQNTIHYVGLFDVSSQPFVNFAYGETKLIPDWFKSVAKWWIEGIVSDQEILDNINTLIDKDIIRLGAVKKKISETSPTTPITPGKNKIPSYTKVVFGFWADDLVSDVEIGNQLKYLVEQGYITSKKLEEKRKAVQAFDKEVVSAIPKSGSYIPTPPSVSPPSDPVVSPPTPTTETPPATTLLDLEFSQSIPRFRFEEFEPPVISETTTLEPTEFSVVPLILTKGKSSEIVLTESGDFEKAVVNWQFEYEAGEPASDLSVYLIIDDENVVLAPSKTDKDGNLSFEFDPSTPPGIHTVNVLSFDADVLFFAAECDFIEVNIPVTCVSSGKDWSQVAGDSPSYSKMNPPIGNSYTAGQTYHVGQGTIQGLGHPEYLESPSDDFYDPEPILVPYVFVEQKSWFAMRHQQESFVSQYKPDENHAYNDIWAGWRFVYSNGEPASGLYIGARGVNNENSNSKFGKSGNTDENGFFEISGGKMLAGKYTFSLADTQYSATYANPFILMTNESGIEGSCFNSEMQGSTLDQKIVLLSKSGSISENYANFEYKLAYEDGEPLKNTWLTHQIECEKWIGMGNNLLYTVRKTITDEFGFASGAQLRGDSEGCTITMWIEELSMDGLPYQAFEQNQEVWEQSIITLN